MAKTQRPPQRIQFDEPTVFQRFIWWCRLRCAAIATGAGLIVVVEVVAFCFVGIPYHLKAIDDAEAAGYNRGRQEAAQRYDKAILEIAREKLRD